MQVKFRKNALKRICLEISRDDEKKEDAREHEINVERRFIFGEHKTKENVGAVRIETDVNFQFGERENIIAIESFFEITSDEKIDRKIISDDNFTSTLEAIIWPMQVTLINSLLSAFELKSTGTLPQGVSFNV